MIVIGNKLEKSKYTKAHLFHDSLEFPETHRKNLRVIATLS